MLQKQQSLVGILDTLPQVTKKEINIFKANNSFKKIKNFESKEELLLINSILTRWSNYLGIDTPEPADLNMLSNFIKDNFSNFNEYDIRECINLLATDSLNLDANHYGKLSPIYVSKCFKAYQEHKSVILHKVRREIEKQEQQKVVIPPDELRVENFIKLLKIAKEENSLGLFYNDAGETLYNFAVYNKLIKFTPELKAEAFDYAEKELKKEKSQKALESVVKGASFKNIKELELNKENYLRKQAREFAVNRWLTSLPLESLIKKINIEMLKY